MWAIGRGFRDSARARGRRRKMKEESVRAAVRRQFVSLNWLIAGVFVAMASWSHCAAQSRRFSDTIGDVRIRRIDGVPAQPGLPADDRMPDIIT